MRRMITDIFYGRHNNFVHDIGRFLSKDKNHKNASSFYRTLIFISLTHKNSFFSTISKSFDVKVRATSSAVIRFSSPKVYFPDLNHESFTSKEYFSLNSCFFCEISTSNEFPIFSPSESEKSTANLIVVKCKKITLSFSRCPQAWKVPYIDRPCSKTASGQYPKTFPSFGNSRPTTTLQI